MLFLYSEATALQENKKFNNKTFNFLKKKKKQQLEPEVEQLTGSKLGKGYDKAIYCHPTYVTSMQSSSYEMPDHKLESRLPGKISTTSDMQTILL